MRPDRPVDFTVDGAVVVRGVRHMAEIDNLARETTHRIRERASELFSKKHGGFPMVQRSAEADAVIESVAYELAALHAAVADLKAAVK